MCQVFCSGLPSLTMAFKSIAVFNNEEILLTESVI